MNRSRFTAMIKAITSAILITVCTVSCGNKTDDPVSPSPSTNVTATPFGTPTAVPWINPTPTPDPNSTPTPTPAPTPTPTPTAAPTATPTPQPTAAPTSRPMPKTMRVPEFEYPFIHDALEAACTSSLPGLTAEFIGSCGVDYYLNTESNKNRIEKMNRISMNIHNGSNERIEFVSWIRQIDTYYLDPGEDGYFEYRLSSAMSLITPGTYTCEIPFRTSSGSEQKLTVEFSLSADGVEKIKNADYKVLFTGKPVIYLYPEKDTPVTVKLDYSGVLNCTYPKYEDGWTVLAHPDGTLEKDGKEYSYLFWDGYADIDYDMSRGWCVKGEDTADFLQEHLSAMGMTPREYNEFIVYWLPLMQNNEYNLITFQHEKYEENAKLDISPAPDSILRVFMVYKPLDGYVSIDAPDDEPTFTRNGFTVVEWGATCLD